MHSLYIIFSPLQVTSVVKILKVMKVREEVKLIIINTF